MNTRQYYYLTTIAEYGNLTYAAEALNVTPSALSKFLAECGQIFGTTLFHGVIPMSHWNLWNYTQRNNRERLPGEPLTWCWGRDHFVRIRRTSLSRMKNYWFHCRQRILWQTNCSGKPVVAFESNDVLLADSMMHQAIGVGFVSKAHVFPCEELVYRPLDPPVRQTLHLRYPLGHELTEPEYYLAGLLAEERLADQRYQPSDDPFVVQMLENAHIPIGLTADGSTHRSLGTALQRIDFCWRSRHFPGTCTVWRLWWECRCSQEIITG